MKAIAGFANWSARSCLVPVTEPCADTITLEHTAHGEHSGVAGAKPGAACLDFVSSTRLRLGAGEFLKHFLRRRVRVRGRGVAGFRHCRFPVVLVRSLKIRRETLITFVMQQRR